MQRKRIDLFSLEMFSRKRLSIETLLKKLKHVVSQESELQHSAKSKLFLLCFGVRVSQNEVLQQKHLRWILFLVSEEAG